MRRTIDLFNSSDINPPHCGITRTSFLYNAQLLQHTQEIHDVPKLDELAVCKAMHFNPRDTKRFSRRRNAGKLTLVCSTHHVARYYQVIFSDLILDTDL